MEVEKHVAEHFGVIHHGVFQDRNLSVTTKRLVLFIRHSYQSVLLYGEECWAPYKGQLVCLNCFHHRCIKNFLG